MLALTECRISGPRVSALAVNEPIVDWVFPSEAELEDDTDVEITPVNHKRKRTQKRERSIPSFQAFARNGVLDAESLLSARSAYFRKPADYFDPFASAVLFFRTAGMDIPSEQVSAPLDDLAELAKYERESFYREQMMLSAIGMSSQEHLDGDKEPSRRSRKSYKTWPGVTSGLGLPETRITFGDTSPLADQAVEMAMLLRRSVVLSDRREASTEEEADRHKEETLWLAEQKAQLQATEGIRLWTAAKAQSSEIGRVAQWLRQVLD
ncbi:hypothetical protein AAFC00_006359 [Neodothiora populina]|uniref:Uncharacterized protein n=1 Tax=Neodothiora populina TaxID=2781224 RepID=A0ABR3P6C4_9PEZI